MEQVSKNTLQKSLRPLPQGISKLSAALATNVKIRLFKATVVHALQQRDPASGSHFCNWVLQSVRDGEVDPYFLAK
jgi:hypothetical protein